MDKLSQNEFMSGEGSFIVDGITGAPAFIEQTDRSIQSFNYNILFLIIYFTYFLINTNQSRFLYFYFFGSIYDNSQGPLHKNHLLCLFYYICTEWNFSNRMWIKGWYRNMSKAQTVVTQFKLSGGDKVMCLTPIFHCIQ